MQGDDGLAALIAAHTKLKATRQAYLSAVADYEAAMAAAGQLATAGLTPLPPRPKREDAIRPAVVAVLRDRPAGLTITELSRTVAGQVQSASKDPVHVARTVIGQMIKTGHLVRDGHLIRLPEPQS